MVGMLASTFSPPDGKHEPSSSTPHFSGGSNYGFVFRGTSLTHEPSKSFLTGYSLSILETSFEAVVTSFFEELSSNQEPLGREFEKVLFENLWDFYQG
ncbi:hypothetical protein Cenrod_1963 [Candidatus Symbiobacter mobilis CR]|uniref:Uncharacterized protein n=2 Tax=Candidatus Symbiobacter TaxID=1436289 RepID=U5NCZ3_9BURK|nr:hypothetical protein Cenrod_1963 [Candidatus Symbiobacter mobilis CR]